jgi:hypothetical protein
MKPVCIGLIVFLATSATADAQIARPILPPTYGSSATGTTTMSGCVSGGGVGAGPITMMSPTIAPSTVAPGSVASSARPITIPPVTITPMYLPPNTSSYEPSAVGTTGTGAAGSVGTTGISPTAAGPIGYRLTGSDMSSWVGRRVQVSGTMVPPEPDALSNPDTPYYQDFDVQSVVPLTGVCPR